MNKENLTGSIFIGVGLILSVYSLYQIFISHHITSTSFPFLVLGPSLMVLGALFRYTSHIAQVEEKVKGKVPKLSNWRVRDLEYRLQKIEQEERKKRKETTKITEEEFNIFKKVTDELLEDLDPSYIKEFSQSKDFQLYQKVMTEEKVGKDEKKKFILLVDRLLGKLSPKKVKEFSEDKKNYQLYQKVVKWAE